MLFHKRLPHFHKYLAHVKGYREVSQGESFLQQSSESFQATARGVPGIDKRHAQQEEKVIFKMTSARSHGYVGAKLHPSA